MYLLLAAVSGSGGGYDRCGAMLLSYGGGCVWVRRVSGLLTGWVAMWSRVSLSVLFVRPVEGTTG